MIVFVSDAALLCSKLFLDYLVRRYSSKLVVILTVRLAIVATDDRRNKIKSK